MTKSAFKLLTVIIIAAAVLGFSGPLWAQAPGITINLSFDKISFAYGEPIGVQAVVSNQSGGDLLISKGFSSRVYYLEMRVIDPAGRLIIATRDGFHDEFPDAPPLAYVLYQGKPVRVAGCEVFAAGEQITSRTEDLRTNFDLSLPGYYSAQVQVSATVFNGAPCAVDDYAWRGLLKSETVYFYVQGSSSGVKVIPDQWKLSWRDDNKKVPDVQVQIRSLEGKGVEDYDPNSINLNTVVAGSVRVLPPKLKAFFNAKEAMESLGDTVQAGQWYRVMITGRLKSGAPFGAEQQVRIVH